jgi:ubiquinone/menaquinone biosynthesis C-methylase UbiE
MKLRESGMPGEVFWETLFDVDLVLHRLHIGRTLRDAVELGCGYGTFSLPIAKAISGTLRTYDIEDAMVKRTCERASEAGMQSLLCEQRDVFETGFPAAAGSQDGAFLFNILHCEEPVRILREAARVISPAGAVYVIHWRHDSSTPRGPSMDIRPKPQECVRWGAEAGLKLGPEGVLDLPPWHYGILLSK